MARKVVTIVFADLIGSTALHERLDPESVRSFMESYYGAMRGAVDVHGGRVTQVMGDGVKAVFGAPRVAEDDAIRAVRAAVEMQRAFRALAGLQSGRVGRTGLRVAVNTGEVVANDETEIIGDPVNVAARLQELGKDGDVVIGGSTQRIVASLVTLDRLGSFALKGRAEQVEAYRVVSLERPAGAAATPFVGRDDELRRLTGVYEAAIAAPAARLAILLGSPGIGKSRLLAEFEQRLGNRATVLTTQCNPAGGATFAPLAEALRTHLGLEAGAAGEALRAAIDARVPGDDAERARIASGIGTLFSGAPASPEESFFAVRRLLAALAAERPVLLVIDDLQWAEPLLLDFTEHLVQWGAGVPLLVLAAARPELRDTRSSFTTSGGLISDVVTLGGLDAGAATRLAARVIGADALPAAVAGRVLTASEGNPLFLGELVRMLVNDGALQKQGERWTLAVDLAELEMPPTIQALLAARIERLRPEERLVLERAAVVGRQFSRAAVTHLLPREAHADLDARLEALRRSELVEPDAGWLFGEPALRFHHALIRDAAYRRVLRGTRAELHGRFADWLEARVGESVEHDETIGWHLEQAHQQLRELGPLDANGLALGERAARNLAPAGRRALARDELRPAASLLGRALDCLGEDDPARAELALDWCEALLAAGDVAPAARAIAELGRFTAGSERLGAWHACFSGELAVLSDPQALRATTDAVAEAAETLASAGDGAGEAKAHFVHARALAQLGRIGACEAALDRALAAARRVGDRRRANAVLAGCPLAALWGPSPVTRASGRCLDVVRVLRITQGAPFVEAVALRCQAVLETLRGRSEAARRMIASSRRMVEELGITQRLLEADMFAGLIELLEGDAALAERWLRTAYEGFREHGLGVAAAQTAALLGRALLAQGRAAEAEAASQESEALAGDDFKAAIAWRGVRAEALAQRGEHAAALELARAAVDIAAATDDLLDHADARGALAVALRAAGRSNEADAEEARAIELWEQKGATLLAERARRSAARVAPADRAPEAGVEPVQLVRRRVRENAATAHAAHEDAAFAARDAGALATLFAEEVEVVDHPNGATNDQQKHVSSLGILLKTQTLTRRHEPLATLGDGLALCRLSLSAGGIVRGDFDVGAYEAERVVLFEVDAQGRCRRSEFFAADRLGDALARLYQRYAELPPEGSARTRAAATARVIAGMVDLPDPDRWVSALAPAVEFSDRRQFGAGSVQGADDLLRSIRPLLELSDDFAVRIDDVLGARSDALLVLWTNSGRDRASGGTFERQFWLVFTFGADGRPTRIEQFDSERADAALARFDELTAEPAAPRAARRRVRPNAATANAARLDAVIRARDAEAVPDLYADSAEIVHHLTGVTYDREGAVRSYRSLISSPGLEWHQEPLATLGDSLALCHTSTFVSASVGKDFDVGAVEREQLTLIDVDANGRRQHSEVFGIDRLGDAIARLYERYAELLLDGPERTRAAATARSVAAMAGPFDPDRYAAAMAPSLEFVDHRTVIGIGSSRGAAAYLDWLRTLFEVAADVVTRLEDVLALRSDAALLRRTTSGSDRAGGGAFERQLLQIWVFGTDGLITREEHFDADRVGEALARFDELAAEPRAVRDVDRRVRANAATANATRLEATIAARDADALPALLADGIVVVNHATGVEHGRKGVLFSIRSLISDPDPSLRNEPLATLGDSLALCHWSVSASGRSDDKFDVGAWENDSLYLFDVDAQGRRAQTEVFAVEHLGDAVVRLYERHAELLPDGPARTRAAATARSVAAFLGSPDPDRRAGAFAPSIEFVDYRAVGPGSLQGADAVRRSIRALFELTELWFDCIDDVLRLRSDALLVRWTHSGTDRASGGAFERSLCELFVFGADGLMARWEQFDAEQIVEALARCDELTSDAPESSFENAASLGLRRMERCWHDRDWEGVVATFGPAYRLSDRRSVIGLELEGEEALASVRMSFDVESGRWSSELLATRGGRLALFRRQFQADGVGAVGAFETGQRLSLIETDADGRRVLQVLFDPDAPDAAYAELDERHAAGEAAPHARSLAAIQRALVAGPPTPWFANAATRAFERLNGAWEAHDWELLAAEYAPDFHGSDRRRAVLLELDRDGYLEFMRMAFELRSSRTRVEVLATRGDRLALGRMRFEGAEPDAGPSEIESLIVTEEDESGQRVAAVRFDLDALDAAYEELDDRYAAGEGAPFGPATTGVRALARAIGARDWDALSAVFAPELVVHDHRPLGWPTLHGPPALVDSWKALAELAPDVRLRIDHVVVSATRSLAVLALVGTREGGAFEDPRVIVHAFDESGRIRRHDIFDVDQLDAARACFAELAAAPPTPWVANAATANFDRFEAAWGARDWERVCAGFAPEFRCSDRRATVHLELDRDGYLAFMRIFWDMSSSQQSYEMLATRGDRLALARMRAVVAERDAGPSEIESFILIEVKENGERVAAVRFDPGDLDAAYAELDERYGATKVNVRFIRSINARDWDGLAALLAPDLVIEDHRLLGWGTLHGSEVYIASVHALVDLAPDASLRFDHFEDSGRGALGISMLKGTREGGAFEDRRGVVVELDAQERIRRVDRYDLDHLDQARARFDAIAGAPCDPLAALIPPNAASAAMDRLQAAFEARDWPAVRALAADGARFEDRRRHALVSGDVDWLVANLKLEIYDSDLGHFRRSLVAAAGDRICLERSLWSGGPAEGRVEIEHLFVAEVDENGRIVTGVMFEVDDRRAAQGEALARLIAADADAAASLSPLAEFLEGYADRDRARMRSVLADDVVYEDHRRTGVGRIEGIDAHLETIAAVWGLMRNDQIDILSVRAIERYGAVGIARNVGTLADGGDVEILWAAAFTAVGGRINRIDQFEIEAVDAALERLAELRPDPLRIPPNAATRAGDRWQQAFEVRDWDTVRALCARILWEDRRPLFRTTGDCGLMLENLRLLAAAGARPSFTLLATAGDRLALQRVFWSGGREGGAFEVDTLRVLEVDAEGRIVADITFDPDDRRAASRELLERWARSDAAFGLPVRARRAILDRDLAGLRAALPDDFVFHDHRRMGAGRMQGADAHVAWNATLLEASPDAINEVLYYVAVEPHAFLSVSHNFGTLADGGAFESVFVVVTGPGFTELFELEDLELARARFEALRPDLTRIPPNAASRTGDRSYAARQAGDWAALPALASPDFVFEDRSKRALVSGGVEMWIQNNQFTQLASFERERIGTVGDRIVLERVLLKSAPDGSPVERENLRLIEVDADGRIRAVIRFDLEDRGSAFSEAEARFVAGEAAASGGQAPLLALKLAVAGHDWESLNGRMGPDAAVHDHRPLSLGELRGDQWAEALRVQVELAPDVQAEALHVLGWNGRGRVAVTRRFGTLRDGGPFENFFVTVAITEGDRVPRYEIFDLADADRALARFDELCAGRP